MKKTRRFLALLLGAVMVLGLLAVPGMAADTEDDPVPEGNQAEGAWVYEVSQA